MWETEQFWGTIDFHIIFFPTMEVNGAPKQPDYKLSSKYFLLVIGRTKKSKQVWIFGWTIPLSDVKFWPMQIIIVKIGEMCIYN